MVSSGAHNATSARGTVPRHLQAPRCHVRTGAHSCHASTGGHSATSALGPTPPRHQGHSATSALGPTLPRQLWGPHMPRQHWAHTAMSAVGSTLPCQMWGHLPCQLWACLPCHQWGPHFLCNTGMVFFNLNNATLNLNMQQQGR